MPKFSRPPLASGVLDRDAATRLSEESLDAAWAEPGTLLLRIGSGQRVLPFAVVEEHSAKLALEPVRGERAPHHLYLGRADGDAVFAALAAHTPEYPEPDAGWHSPLTAAINLPPLHLELMSTSLALTNWHRSMPFSARDGEATTPAQGGWARIDEHGGEHFPRTDPAVIVLVEHEDRVLLGSNVLWDTGRFSLLAGFVEAGESAEHAVVREVLEETGMPVDDVRYVGSQPWPFPRSLMLGFRARLAAGADPGALRPDPAEISELRWFTRDEVSDPPPGITLPTGLSIARWLIDIWLAEGKRA